MTKLESLLMLLKEILKKKLRNLTQAVTKKLKQAALTKMTQCFKLPKSEDLRRFSLVQDQALEGQSGLIIVYYN